VSAGLDLRRAAALGLGLLALVGAVQWIGRHAWREGPPRIEAWEAGPRSGDEVHYSVVLHSLLFDGDLELRDDYAAASGEGWESGRFWRGRVLDRHTILLDPEMGRTLRWQDIWNFQERVPCETPGCVPFAPRRPHGFPDLARVVEHPAHPPAFPAVLAALSWPASPEPDEVDETAGALLRAIGSLTLLATAATALALGQGPGVALGAAALLGLASPWVVYTKSFFSEGAAAAVLMLGLGALVSGLPWLAALLAVLAMWLKPALVAVGAGWIVERWWAGDRRAAAWITAIMTVGGLALIGFNHFAIGEVLVSGAWAWVPPRGLSTFFSTLVHPRYGVLVFVPWLVLTALAMGRDALRERPEAPWLQIAIPSALHLGILSLYGAVGASCYGPRYWIPFLPWFALAAAADLRRRGLGFRAAFVAAALFAAATSLASALQYESVWDEEPWHALVRMVAAWSAG